MSRIMVPHCVKHEGYKPLLEPKPPKAIEVTIHEIKLIRIHKKIMPVKTTILDAIHDAFEEVMNETWETILDDGHCLQNMGWKKVEVCQTAGRR